LSGAQEKWINIQRREFMRIMGLDLGDATIGVAVSDELGMIAHGITTIRRKSIKHLQLFHYIFSFFLIPVMTGLNFFIFLIDLSLSFMIIWDTANAESPNAAPITCAISSSKPKANIP
jgi:hypothetical protein